MSRDSSKVVVIVGMHRSGTSMVGGVLTRLGVDLGDDFPGRQEFNPLGHYEDGDFLQLNQTLLKSSGGSWYQPPSWQELKQHGDRYADRIDRLIKSRSQTADRGIWGWKDPRTSLTLGLFSPRLENPYILWCRRDPREVAESLWKRNKFRQQRSLELTGIYNQRIADFLEKNPTIPVLELPYQEIIADPELWIERMIQFLKIHPSQRQTRAAVSFILPPPRIERERKRLRWKQRLTLPYRAVRKLWKLILNQKD